MKSRQGFVSNSSSSSFIVCFSKDPTARVNLEADMGDCYSSYDWDDTPLMTFQVLDRVHQDILEQMPATKEDICRELAYDMPYNAGTKKKDNEDFDQYWERRDKERVKYGEAEYIKHKEFFENNHVYILSYADDEGEAELEHGNIFRNLPFSIAVSYH